MKLKDKQSHKLDEIDIIELFRFLWSKRLFILKMTVCFIIIGLIIAFGSRKEYKSEVKLLPDLTASEGGTSGLLKQFGGLGSLAGIDLSAFSVNAGLDAIAPKLYPEVIKSTPFILELLNTRVNIPSKDTTATVFDYLNKILKPSLTGYLKKYTIELPFHIISLRNRQTESPLITGKEGQYISINLVQYQVIRELNQRLEILVDTRTGIITVSALFPDAYVSAVVSDTVINYLRNYITEYRLEKARKNLKFIKELNEDAEKVFITAQKELAAFRDENMNVISAAKKSEEVRLEAVYNLSFNVYNNLSQQLEQAKITVQEETPLFKILNPPVISGIKSKPKRMTILLIITLIGFASAIGTVLIKKNIDE